MRSSPTPPTSSGVSNLPFTQSASAWQQNNDLRLPLIRGLRKGIRTKWLRVVSLIAVDSLALGSCGYLITHFWGVGITSKAGESSIPWTILLTITSLAFMAAAGLYREGEHRRNYWGCIKTLTLSICFLLLITLVLGLPQGESWSHFSLIITAFWLSSSLLTSLGRCLIEFSVEQARRQGLAHYSAFIIAEPEHRHLTQQLIAKEGRYNILGVAESKALDRANRDALIERLKFLKVDEIFTDWDSIHRRTFLFRRLQSTGATLRILPLRSDIAAHHGQLWSIDHLTLFTLSPTAIVGVDFLLKRCFDFLLSILVLAMLSPVYLAIAILIKLDSPGPIFYRQWRVGLHGKEFQVWKFRSMIADADKAQAALEKQNEMADGILFKMKADPRITRVGQFIRRYSLDELPQIFNVLKGDMSIVGPRPLPVRDVQRFSQESFFIRHEVLPGITGLWQVSGRSDIEDFEHAVALDMRYIESWSLGLDLTIILKTFSIVFSGTGAY